MDKHNNEEGLLGGFKPILSAFSNDFDEGTPFSFANEGDEELTDEEIEALKGKSAPPVLPVKEGKTKTEQVEEEEEDE